MNILTVPAVSKTVNVGIIAVLLLGLTGCVQQNYKPTKTSIELQAIQTRDFDVDKEIAYAATVSTFQDMGYSIQSAELSSGFITANGPTHQRFVPFVGRVMESLNATAFIEPMGAERSKIRLNFVNASRSSSGYGMQGGNDVPVEDGEFYQDAFEKISKSIFVRQSY